MNSNITLSLDRELISRVRVLAAKSGLSISRLMAQELERLVGDAERYERSRKNAVAELEAGYHLGGLCALRDELHER